MPDRYWPCFTCGRRGFFEEGEQCGDCQYKTDPEFRRMVDAMERKS